MVESAESDGDISEGSFSLTVDALTGIGASTGDKLYDAGAPEPTEWVPSTPRGFVCNCRQ